MATDGRRSTRGHVGNMNIFMIRMWLLYHVTVFSHCILLCLFEKLMGTSDNTRELTQVQKAYRCEPCRRCDWPHRMCGLGWPVAGGISFQLLTNFYTRTISVGFHPSPCQSRSSYLTSKHTLIMSRIYRSSSLPIRMIALLVSALKSKY